jgi:hypothetical protein
MNLAEFVRQNDIKSIGGEELDRHEKILAQQVFETVYRG